MGVPRMETDESTCVLASFKAHVYWRGATGSLTGLSNSRVFSKGPSGSIQHQNKYKHVHTQTHKTHTGPKKHVDNNNKKRPSGSVTECSLSWPLVSPLHTCRNPWLPSRAVLVWSASCSLSTLCAGPRGPQTGACFVPALPVSACSEFMLCLDLACSGLNKELPQKHQHWSQE